MRSRKQRAWGGPAWTDPIPTHPRITASDDFVGWPMGIWTFVENSRTSEVLEIRAYREGFAEVKRPPAA